MGRKDYFQSPNDVLHRFSVSVSGRGTDGHHAFGGSVQLAVERLIFCDCSLSLCSGGCDRYWAFWRFLLLVSEGDGPHDERDAGEMALLALYHWISSDLRRHAYSRDAGDAAKDLYV